MKPPKKRRLTGLLGRDDNLKYYTLNGILFTIVTIFSRTYAPKFMDRLGATSLHYSLFNALPGFVAVLTTLPGILLISRAQNKGRIMRRFFYLSRFFPLLLLATPYLPQPLRAYAFVVLFSLMNLPESIAQTALQSWTGSIFSPQDRAGALSTRNKLSQVIMICFSALAGFVLSLPDPKNNQAVLLIYQLFFLSSVVFGLFEIRTLSKIHEVTTPPPQKKFSPKASFQSALAHREFRSFLLCSLLFHFGWQMGWPLFNFYQINVLKANELWLTLINVMSSLFMVLSYNFWANHIRRHGYKFTTAVVCMGMAISPVLYALSRTLPINAIMSISMGIFTSGVTVVILGSLLESAPPEEVMMCTALHTTLTNVTLFISPFLGELILKTFSVYHALYVSAAIRLLGALAFLIRWRRDPAAKSGPGRPKRSSLPFLRIAAGFARK
ncbi:hypothetical protein ABB02_01283 [Clostridiaceae bacterium JG1575]|nr:hypothetical protein ABB02_01283 [Clostridiaceae bacterium JG1575]